MQMLAAIARSAGNKAEAYNDQGRTVIVLRLFYPDHLSDIYHVWIVEQSEAGSRVMGEWDMATAQIRATLVHDCQIDSDAYYWQPV